MLTKLITDRHTDTTEYIITLALSGFGVMGTNRDPRLTPKASIGRRMGGISLPQRTGVKGSVISSSSGVRDVAPADNENDLCRF